MSCVLYLMSFDATETLRNLEVNQASTDLSYRRRADDPGVKVYSTCPDFIEAFSSR